MEQDIKTAVIQALLSGKAKIGFSVPQFVEASSIGRSKIYEDIKSGKLKARKKDKRTLITIFDGIAYLENLPTFDVKS